MSRNNWSAPHLRFTDFHRIIPEDGKLGGWCRFSSTVEPLNPEHISATLHVGLSPCVEIGEATITLETTRFSDLRRNHFSGAVGHSNDPAASLSWSCTDAEVNLDAVRICAEGDRIQGDNIISTLTIERIVSP